MRLLGGKKQKTEINKRIPLVLDKKIVQKNVISTSGNERASENCHENNENIEQKKKTKIHFFRTLEINQ